MDLYLFKFNNYYNRIAKKFDTIEEYFNEGDNLHVERSVNFNPNDGISTEQILNYSGDIPDYLICIGEGNQINSRWFVIEAVRTRAMQFKLTLYRDVISDWWNDVMNAPAYVEKGWVYTDDPAIYNDEAMTFNQIKKDIYPLKDETECQWIVGYIPKNLAATNVSKEYIQPKIALELNSLSDWSLYGDLGFPFVSRIKSVKYKFPFNMVNLSLNETIPYNRYNFYYEFFNNRIARYTPDDVTENLDLVNVVEGYGLGYSYGNGTYNVCGSLGVKNSNFSLFPELIIPEDENVAKNIFDAFEDYFKESYSRESDIASYEGKYIKTPGGIYRIKKTIENATLEDTLSRVQAYNLIKNFIETPNDSFNATLNTSGATNLEGVVSYITETYDIEDVTLDFALSIKPGERQTCVDSPYDIFCMPYSDTFQIKANSSEGVRWFTSNKEFNLAVASEIAADLGSASIYDIQLLPYCPVREMLIYSDVRKWCIDATGYAVTMVEDIGGNPLWPILWATTSSNSFTINAPDVKVPLDPIEFKVSSQCDFLRLSSPTDGSYFDFTVTKNDGIPYFNIEYTYKPFQSYINISPEFGGLYGESFKWDKRGLILKGDFSIPKTSSAWADYKNSNQNYEAIFNRQIENIETNNAVQREQELWSAGAGMVAGGASGALIGTMIMPGIGTALGALGGGLLSLAGGIKDFVLNEELRNETIDYTTDNFGYNMQQIKARSNTLTNISAFDIDCSPFPLLEFYSCTETEKEALRNKIKYNGMTIMRIGTLNQFLNNNGTTYIKGKIIRMDDIIDDFHVVNTIAKEINMGVFI